MKFYIALLLFTLQVKLCLSAGSAADTVDGKLPALFMNDILNDADPQKRVVSYKDLLSHVSCRYIRKNGYCKYSFIKNKLCHITCNCRNVLSQKSCNIVKAKNKCKTSWNTFCRFTCDRARCGRLSCKTSSPLGMKSGAIPDARIKASSMFNQNHSPERARLDIKATSKVGAWCAKNNNANQWLQVDLGKVTKVTHIATQGRQDNNEWVRTYSVQYSLNGKRFVDCEGGKIFTGNTNRNTIVKHALKPAIFARYIRVRPKTWQSHICMRMELYGCK